MHVYVCKMYVCIFVRICMYVSFHVRMYLPICECIRIEYDPTYVFICMHVRIYAYI
jgi:hypothetical protein